MAITVGGTTITRPGAYSQVDSTAMTPLSLGAFNILAFVGVAPALKSGTDANTVLYFNSPTAAKAIIGAGELIEHMNAAWQHGADLIGVSVVVGTGTAGAVQDTDWDKAIARLEFEDVDGIVPVTTTGALQAKFATHIASMSNVSNRLERRGFFGHVKGSTVAAVKALAGTLGGERAVLATPAPAVFGADGTTKSIKDSTYMAAAYAGIWASQNPQEPITYKYIKFPGLEKRYTNAEISELLTAGVAPVEVVRGKGFRIVQGVTTSVSADLTQKELSVSTLKDVMSSTLRMNLEEKYVGKAGVAGIEVSIRNDVVSMILNFVKRGWISTYVAESIQIVRDGTNFEVEWEGKPTLPINNFVITSHFTL